MTMLGLTLQPEREYIDLLQDLFFAPEVDYFEVAPETTWRYRNERLEPNGFSEKFLQIGREAQKPFVAHGVGFSVGTASPKDEARRERWLAQLKEDQQKFGYLWYTDHFGASSLDGRAITLPGPIWLNQESKRLVRRSLDLMRSITPEVGVENSVFYFLLSEPLAEADFFRDTLEAPYWMLLDLHNLYTLSVNFGADPKEYLDRLDLHRVIEIHISGGNESEASWLPSRRVMRLDSHDQSIPEEVWSLLEEVLPRCPNIRGVTLERMEGTVQEKDVPLLYKELRRAKKMIQTAKRPTQSAPIPTRREASILPCTEAEHLSFEALLADLVCSYDPIKARQGLLQEGALSKEQRGTLAAIDEDGLRMTALLVARLRFERLLRGSPEAEAFFESDPKSFAQAFRAYHQEVPPTAFFPPQEAGLFRDWRTQNAR